MRIHDFALVTFTILMQLSVGAFAVLTLVRGYVARRAGAAEAARLTNPALYCIPLAAILALVASLLHLGVPLRAYTAVNNFATSWLSREVVLAAAFTGLAVLVAFLEWRKLGGAALRNLLAWVAVLVGLVLVYSMANVYLLDAQPAWNTWVTPVTFFVTSFLLGTLAVGAVLVATHASAKRKEAEHAKAQSSLVRDLVRWIAIASVVLLGIELVTLPFYLASLAAGPAEAQQTAQALTGPFSWALVLRLALVFLGAGVFALFVYQNALSPGREKVLGNLAFTAFAMVLAAEVLGRYLFYATHFRIGI